MNEENKIQDAEVTSVEEVMDLPQSGVAEKKSFRFDLYIELALFLILGFLIGIAIKTEAAKRITVGYEDYKMTAFSQSYNINKLENLLAQKREEAAASQANATEEEVAAESSQGGSCGN